MALTKKPPRAPTLLKRPRNSSAATTALQSVQPELARGVARGVLHKNTAARKFGRLTKRVSALG